MTKVKRNYTNKTEEQVEVIPVVVETNEVPTEVVKKKRGRRPSKARQQFLEKQKEEVVMIPSECISKEKVDEIIDKTPVKKVKEFKKRVSHNLDHCAKVETKKPNLFKRFINWLFN